MKVVINRCWGGFNLSHAGVMAYAKLTGRKLYAYDSHGIEKLKPYNPKAQKKEPLFLTFFSKKGLKKWPEEDGVYFDVRGLERNDPNLVAVVEKLGKKASARLSNLVVVEIPDGTEWEIDDYDGMETVEERHRSWV